jgi:hypothetical protein
VEVYVEVRVEVLSIVSLPESLKKNLFHTVNEEEKKNYYFVINTMITTSCNEIFLGELIGDIVLTRELLVQL